MDLSELTAYAEEKYHIREQHKWDDFPGFSVLADPNTGKWLALLMRHWDAETGTEIQWCDIKCGRQVPDEFSAPYLRLPFRMQGEKWAGVLLNDVSRPETVFRLFDRALHSGDQRGYTVVLSTAPEGKTSENRQVYRETALPFAGQNPGFETSGIPERIREMQRLYEYGDGSFAQKCRNFYRQGKFMEDYEDNEPWTADYQRYFPTYNDLSVRQLRGYFSWRTGVRKGEYGSIAESLAYIYVYELLNGIGCISPEDSLRKMSAFETGFLDSGIGNQEMRKNLRRWMLEYAVLHNIPAERTRELMDPEMLEKDKALAVLKTPAAYSDEAVFSALCTLEGKRLRQSPVAAAGGDRGKRLFAEIWRCVSDSWAEDGKTVFSACFGELKAFRWYPLANAVWREEKRYQDTVYMLDESRSYQCLNGTWRELRYDIQNYDRDRFETLLHEADRALRRYLKTGRYLREKPGGAWAKAYVGKVIEADRKAQIEAARPKINIDLSGLEQIRRNASVTRDSLLTEEEKEEWPEIPVYEESSASVPEESRTVFSAGKAEETAPRKFEGLDRTHLEILSALLRGLPVSNLLRDGHLMPAVAADTINEAFFDEVGDSILECDGDRITVIEDYREDIAQILGGAGG